jgi:sugar phosphate isomerase/epimerase
MWAMQPRFERDLPAFVERAAELGFGAIELNHSMNHEHLDAFRTGVALPATSVHAPAPLERHSRWGWNRDLNLASVDEEERALAVRYAQRSVELASEIGARAVVVHLGQITSGAVDGELKRRELFEGGTTGGDIWAHAGTGAAQVRAQLAPPYLAQAHRSLDELATAAQAAGVVLGLETRLHYHQFPLPEEAVMLLADYPPEVAGYWHDSGHAEVLDRLGFVALDAWFERLGDRVVGTHITDVRDLVDHRAPGNGDLDFAALAAHIPPSAVRTFEVDQHEPDEDVARALDLTREVGLVG